MQPNEYLITKHLGRIRMHLAAPIPISTKVEVSQGFRDHGIVLQILA